MNFISLTEPFGPPSPLAPLSDTRITTRVLALVDLVEEVEQPADVVVGVRQEAGVDLGHPREEALLLVRQRVPRASLVHHRERLAVGPGARRGRTDRIDRWQLGVGRDDAELLLAGERLLAHRLVAHVELALVPVGPLPRHVMRRVARARRVVQEERLLRRDGLGVADELDRLVGDVVGEVVALLGRARLVDGVVVVDEIGIPLAGLGAEEPVPALEATTARPVAARRGEVHLDLGTQVPLAHHVGVPAELAEDLREHPVLGRDRAARAREPDSRLGDARHAVPRVIPAGEQARPRRRAQRSRVPLRVPHAVGRDLVDVRRLDRSAVAAHRRETDVVEHDVHDVRRPVGCRRRLERTPVRHRVTDIHLDATGERLGHLAELLVAVVRRRLARWRGTMWLVRRPRGPRVVRSGRGPARVCDRRPRRRTRAHLASWSRRRPTPSCREVGASTGTGRPRHLWSSPRRCHSPLHHALTLHHSLARLCVAARGHVTAQLDVQARPRGVLQIGRHDPRGPR